jgi:hypothetical protein
MFGRRLFGKVPATATAQQQQAAPELDEKAWISDVFRPDGLRYRRGYHTKFHGHEWEPATYEIPAMPNDVYNAYRRHREGLPLTPMEFPEAIAVFNERNFAREKEFFFPGGFSAVKGKLVDVLNAHDLGGTGLVPIDVRKADRLTPYGGEYFYLNFASRKDSLLPDRSKNVERRGVHHKTGVEYWSINSWFSDGDVALSGSALDGADLWLEAKVTDTLFVSDRLAKALTEIGLADRFRLKACRII